MYSPSLLLVFLSSALLARAQSSSSSTSSGSSTSSVAGSSGSSASSTSSAAFPSLSPYSSCVVDCLSLSTAAANCSSPVDVDCYCSQNGTRPFTDEMVACVKQGCSSDLSKAESLVQQFCALASQSTSLSFPTSVTFTPISLPSTTAPPSTSANSTSNGPTSSTTSATPSPSSNAAVGHEASNFRLTMFTIITTLGCCFAAVLL